MHLIIVDFDPLEYGEMTIASYENCTNLFGNILWADDAVFYVRGVNSCCQKLTKANGHNLVHHYIRESYGSIFGTQWMHDGTCYAWRFFSCYCIYVGQSQLPIFYSNLDPDCFHTSCSLRGSTLIFQEWGWDVLITLIGQRDLLRL